MQPQTPKAGVEVLHSLDQTIKRDFESNRRILSFDEYLALVAERPEHQIRGSAQYLVDLLDAAGEREIPNRQHHRFNLFDQPINGLTAKLVGHERVQEDVYRDLRSFVRQGTNNRLILLHGPNGSAKSSIVHALMGGMERYSLTDEGAVYTFNWIFPVDKIIKKGIGLGTYDTDRGPIQSFAKLSDDEISARIPCDLKDHPLLLIPRAHRRAALVDLLGESKTETLWSRAPAYLRDGDLCHRCKEIFESLLIANQGDYRRILQHIQVERFFYSRRYCKGLATIEPQMHVDANYHQLSIDKRLGQLPPSLQGLSYFTLGGSLVDGNRGIIEFSDLLKRPLDASKYLLTACETGAIHVGATNAYLDLVFIGSTNEIQLDAFKEMPDFSSFKARIELIRVPYLLRVSEEEEIYRLVLPQVASEKHITPHVAWTLALWTVLTRLKKPNSINYPPNVSAMISKLTPLEKAKLYDTGEMPEHLSPEDRKSLKSHVERLQDEYTSIPYYEGRMGASVREVRGMLFDAAQNQDFKCLSPLSVFQELEAFVKQISDYEFLKQDIKDGYHDSAEFINTVQNAYLDRVDREVTSSLGIFDLKQWEDFIKKYVVHLSHFLKKEKLQNSVTGKYEEPDRQLLSEFEKIQNAPDEDTKLDTFRRQIISRVGAWALDHPREQVVYSQVFPEYWARIEKHFYDSQKAVLAKLYDALQTFDTERADQKSDGHVLAQKTLDNMVTRHGYCPHCAKEVVSFLMKKRY